MELQLAAVFDPSNTVAPFLVTFVPVRDLGATSSWDMLKPEILLEAHGSALVWESDQFQVQLLFLRELAPVGLNRCCILATCGCHSKQRQHLLFEVFPGYTCPKRAIIDFQLLLLHTSLCAWFFQASPTSLHNLRQEKRLLTAKLFHKIFDACLLAMVGTPGPGPGAVSSSDLPLGNSQYGPL
jgi:hypothetical protein